MMIKNMFAVISNPKAAFLRIQDRKRTIFVYIFLLILIMSLPALIAVSIKSESLFVSDEQIKSQIHQFYDDELVISNYELVDHEFSGQFTIDIYTFVVGDAVVKEIGFIFKLATTGVETYYNLGSNMMVLASSVTYENLEVENLEFKNENKEVMTNLFINAYKHNKPLIVAHVSQEMFTNAFEMLLLILFLTVIAAITKKMPLTFGHHFKINTYLVTSYALATLILKLFGLYSLNYIAVILAYIYHFIAYGSIRVVVNKKEDSDE